MSTQQHISPRSRTVAHEHHDDDQTLNSTGLQKNDVLLGRGTGPNEYEGNVRFRKMIRDALRSSSGVVLLDPKNKNTKELSNTATKTDLARRVVRQVASRGGRFLRKLSKEEEATVALKGMFKDDGTRRPAGSLTRKGDDFYVEVSNAIAVEKTKQSLRHQRRRARSQQVRVVGRGGFQTQGSSISLGGTTSTAAAATATRILLTSSNTKKNKKAAGTSRPSTPSAASSSCIVLEDNTSPGGAINTIPTRAGSSKNSGHRCGGDRGTAMLLSAAAVDAYGEFGTSDGVGPNKKRKKSSITTPIEEEEEDTRTGGGQATSSCSGSATNSFSTSTTDGGRNEEDDHPPLSSSLREESTIFYQHDPFKNPASHDLLLSQQQHHSLMMPPPAPTVPPASLPGGVSFFLNPSRMSSCYYHPRPCCAHADADASTDSSLPFTATAALMRTRRAMLASSSPYYVPAAINFVLASGEPSLVERTAALAEDTNTALRQFLGSSSLFLPPAGAGAGAGAGAAIFPSPSLLGRIDSLIYPRPTPSSAVPGFGYGSPPAEQQQAALLNYLLCSGTNNPHYY